MPRLARKWERIDRLVGPLFRAKNRRPFWEALEHGLINEEPLDNFDEWRALWRCLWLGTMFPNEGQPQQLLKTHRRVRQSRGRSTDDDELLYQWCRLGLAYNSKERRQYETLYLSLDWDRLPAWPFLRALRLLIAVTHNKRAEVKAALAKGVGTPFLSEDRAQYLRILAEHFHSRGQARRALRLYEKASQILGNEAGIFAGIQHASMLALTALTAMRARQPIDECTRWLEKAEAVNPCFSPPIQRIRMAMYRAILLYKKGQPVEARACAKRIIRFVRSKAAYRLPFASFELNAWATKLSCEIDLARPAAAKNCVRAASKVLRRCDTPKHHGIFHLMRGALFGAHAGRGAAKRALAELDRAEEFFHKLGDRFELGLSEVYLARGEIFEKIENAQAALECATRISPLPNAFLDDACLELKSRILLSPRLPNRHRLYEDILANLGRAWGPAPLFKVVANLYMYSWELGQDLEMTDYHLRQVHRMADHLEASTFHRLYMEHVAKPVFQRAIKKTFGFNGAT